MPCVCVVAIITSFDVVSSPCGVVLTGLARRPTTDRGQRGGRTALVACVFLLRLVEPSGVVGVADDAHRDRHEGMILAAELGALTVIDAFPQSLEPGLVDAARDGIHLHPEGRHREGM